MKFREFTTPYVVMEGPQQLVPAPSCGGAPPAGGGAAPTALTGRSIKRRPVDMRVVKRRPSKFREFTLRGINR